MTLCEVLFVCSGNICRSPYTEGYLRHRLGAGSSTRTGSGGTLGLLGHAPSPETVKLALAAGFDVSELRSKGVTYEAVDEADHILVMEDAHRRALQERFPEDALKIHLLSETHPLVPDPGRAPDIFDPIGLPLADYERCFALIRESIDGLLASGRLPGAGRADP